jgi:WD40 repeat protein
MAEIEEIILPILSLDGHEEDINSVSFLPIFNEDQDYMIMATGSSDKTTKIWSINRRELREEIFCLDTVNGNNEDNRLDNFSKVFNVDFYANENLSLLVTTSTDMLFKLWIIDENDYSATCIDKIIKDARCGSNVVFHKSAYPPIFATKQIDDSIYLWRVNPHLIHNNSRPNSGHNELLVTRIEVPNSKSKFLDIAFHPTLLLMATTSINNTVNIWKVSDNLASVTKIINFTAHFDIIFSIVFHQSINPIILATGSAGLDSTTKLWSINPRKWEVNCNITISNENLGEVYTVAFHPTANPPILATLVFGNLPHQDEILQFYVKIFELRDDFNTAICRANIIFDESENVTSIVFHPSEPILASTQDKTVKLWKLNARGIPINYIEPIAAPFLMQTRIIISQDLHNPSNSSNKSCPSFIPLYNFIMQQDLSNRFFFIYEGRNEHGIDAGGPKRDIFDKILPVYTNKFFKKIESNGDDFIILKEDIDFDLFIIQTAQLICLANAAETPIFLRIEPRLLELLKSQKPKEFINNSKKESFSNLFTFFEENIFKLKLEGQNLNEVDLDGYFINNNQSNYFKNNNSKRKLLIKNHFQQLENSIKKEILFRRFAVVCGFTNWKQFENMHRFIIDYYIRFEQLFSSELKFDIESFLQKLNIKRTIDEFSPPINIPLSNFGRLSPNKKEFIFNDLKNNANSNNYTYLIQFLKLLLGPQSTDIDRKIFIGYITGSIYYPGELYIELSYISKEQMNNNPFNPSTCSKKLMIYLNRERFINNMNSIDILRNQMIRDSGFARA